MAVKTWRDDEATSPQLVKIEKLVSDPQVTADWRTRALDRVEAGLTKGEASTIIDSLIVALNQANARTAPAVAVRPLAELLKPCTRPGPHPGHIYRAPGRMLACEGRRV